MRALAVALILAAGLLAPAAATASTVGITADGRTVFRAGAEANDVVGDATTSLGAQQLTFTDGGSAITPGTGCVAGPPVTCSPPAGGVFGPQIEYHLGDGDDRVVAAYAFAYPIVSGGDGSDRLYGAGQNSEVSGGDGNDVVVGHSNAAGPLNGDAGEDLVVGHEHSGTLHGGWGHDFLVTTVWGASVTGGPGWDTLIGLGRGGTFTAGGDNDLVGFGPGVNGATVNAGGAMDRVRGSDGPDVIDAGGGSDVVDVQGDGAVDTVDCGNEFDWVYADADDVVSRCEVVERVAPAPADPELDAAIARGQAYAAAPFADLVPLVSP
jgi:Ca2+-binding RTX toxin-like protein